MDLKTNQGFELVKKEELEKHKEIKSFIPVVRNAVSKAWRMLDKMDKLLNKEVK